jgi:hypothetical protein
MIVDAPWYVPNTVIRRDLQTPVVKEEIRRYSSQYSARFSAHPNDLILCGRGLEYLHRCPASRKSRQKGNPVPGGI